MGSLFGLLCGISIVISTWNGTLEFWGFGAFIIAGLVGLFLMPTTVGTFMTGIMIATPFALLAGLIHGHAGSSGLALLFGVCAFVTQFIIGAAHSNSL